MTDFEKEDKFAEWKGIVVRLRCTRGCCFINPEWEDDIAAHERGHSSARSTVEVQGFRVALSGGR